MGIFFYQQREHWTLNHLGVEVIHLTIFVCILFLGIWWADSTYLRERFHVLMRSSRFVKKFQHLSPSPDKKALTLFGNDKGNKPADGASADESGDEKS